MKIKLFLITAVLLMIAAVSCVAITDLPGARWHSIAYAAEAPGTSAGIMIVFYTIADEEYLFWCDIEAEIIDNGGTWDVTSNQVTAIGVRKAVVAYDYFQYKPITPNLDEYGNVTTTYLAELDLQPITADDLPRSEHIGKLTAVDTGLARPATVTRKWMGQTYDVQCLVSQSVVDLWIADDLNVGDFVIVSFIDEIPDTTEIHIAIVTDKVYESWS